MTVTATDVFGEKPFRTRLRNAEHMAVQAVEPNDKVTLATALTTGSGAAITVGFAAGNTPPGYYQLTPWGTLGTSSLKLQFSPDSGTTWLETDVSNITAFRPIGISIVEGQYRVTVVTPGGGSSWNADLRGAI